MPDLEKPANIVSVGLTRSQARALWRVLTDVCDGKKPAPTAYGKAILRSIQIEIGELDMPEFTQSYWRGNDDSTQ